MKAIDENLLETDLAYRYQYLCEFIGFREDDVAEIYSAARALGPYIHGLVDAVYAQLFKYDATLRHFLPTQRGYDGDIPLTLEGITTDHPHIVVRKEHLGRYFATLLTKPYDVEMAEYLDWIGTIHTVATTARLQIPLVQMNALMGYIADAFHAIVLDLGLPRDREAATLRALSKLLWIQNDLISRHYVPPRAAAMGSVQ
jgi:hypothetical protein